MKAIRAGICILIALEVFALGGVESWGVGILEVGAAALLLFWGILVIGQRVAVVRWSWLCLPLLVLEGFAVVQYSTGISVYPYATKLELLKWAAYLLVFFLVAQAFHTASQVQRLVWFLVILSFAVSLFGIVQHYTSDGTVYWLVTLPPGAGPFGPYVNRDHFAGFVELTAPLGLALYLFGAYRREHAVLLLLFTVVSIGAVTLSASRGGILALGFEFVLLLFLARSQRFGKKQMLAGAALALVAGAFLVWLGVSPAIERFKLLTPSDVSVSRRVSMYRDTWQIFARHRWLGTGLGTLRTVYPGYASYYDARIVDHAHNDYLELLADTGLVGALCGLAFISLLFAKAIESLRAAQRRLSRAVVAGPLAACAGLLLHSLVDFNLHIPANALLFLLLASVAASDLNHLRPAVPSLRESSLAQHSAPALVRTS